MISARSGLFSRGYLRRRVFTGYRVSDPINFQRERTARLHALLPAVTYANYVSTESRRANTRTPVAIVRDNALVVLWWC